jgi:hypothetical protein
MTIVYGKCEMNHLDFHQSQHFSIAIHQLYRPNRPIRQYTSHRWYISACLNLMRRIVSTALVYTLMFSGSGKRKLNISLGHIHTVRSTGGTFKMIYLFPRNTRRPFLQPYLLERKSLHSVNMFSAIFIFLVHYFISYVTKRIGNPLWHPQIPTFTVFHPACIDPTFRM